MHTHTDLLSLKYRFSIFRSFPGKSKLRKVPKLWMNYVKVEDVQTFDHNNFIQKWKGKFCTV